MPAIAHFWLFSDETFGPIMRPIFITCDPARDTPEQVKAYVKGTRFCCSMTTRDLILPPIDFHPRLLGLTGSYDNIKAACKAYRVYFSTPPNTKLGDDYLVDHSIFFYLMDHQGEFVDAYGKSMLEEDVRDRIVEAIKAWKPKPSS